LGENKRELTLRKGSSANLSDFLLAFALTGSAFEGVEYAKRDEIDDSSGFHFASAQRNAEKKTSCLLY
jgi:hypothetical protein